MNRVQQWGASGAIVAAVLGMLATVTLGSHPPAATPPVHLIEAYDRSGSYRRYLPDALSAGADLTERLESDQTHLTCYALDTGVTELFDNRPPDSASDLCDLLEDRLGAIPTARGTAPSRLFAHIADRCEKEPGPFLIAVYTDGDLDAPDTWAALQRAANRLARTGKVAFLGFYGVAPENRLNLKAAFAAFPYDQFRLYAPGETETDALLQRLNAVHAPHQETNTR